MSRRILFAFISAAGIIVVALLSEMPQYPRDLLHALEVEHCRFFFPGTNLDDLVSMSPFVVTKTAIKLRDGGIEGRIKKIPS